MASISVNLPWQSLLAAHLPALRDGMARELGVEARIEAGEDVLVVDAASEASPAAVAFAVAEHLAPIWPALLAAYGVELRVAVSGSSWTADAALMAELAGGGVASTTWLAGAEFASDS